MPLPQHFAEEFCLAVPHHPNLLLLALLNSSIASSDTLCPSTAPYVSSRSLCLFSRINRWRHHNIFIHCGCGDPQHFPGAFNFIAATISFWTSIGVAACAAEYRNECFGCYTSALFTLVQTFLAPPSIGSFCTLVKQQADTR